MTRIQRQIAYETALAYDHYDQLIDFRSRYHGGPHLPSRCPVCQSIALYLTHALSTPWHKVSVEALFRKGRTEGVCKPVHR